MVYWVMMSTRIHFNTRNTLIIKHSEFITHLFRAFSFEEAKVFLNDLKALHPEATHVTYAYRSLKEERTGDDGEVPGTAGKMELKVLKEQDLVDILAVVIRYYGGTDLGINGLIRAYTDSVVEAMKTTQKTALVPCVELIVTLPIAKLDTIRRFHKDSLRKTEFDEDGLQVTLTFITQDKALEETLRNQTQGKLQVISQREVIEEQLLP